MTLSAHPERLAKFLFGILVALMFANALGLVLVYVVGYDYALGFVPMFNVGIEGTVPALFATLLLLSSAALFFVLYRLEEIETKLRRVWIFLAALFVFLAVDESVGIHELLERPIRDRLNLSGYLYFSWVVPYAVGIVIVAAYVGPSLWALGPRYRRLFGIAAITFVGGAMGVEMLSAKVFESGDARITLGYRLLQMVEETMEFIGVIVLVYTLMDLIRARTEHVQLRFKQPNDR